MTSIYQKRQEIEAAWDWKVSWAGPDTWHMTWMFMGDVPQSDVPKLQDKLTKAVTQIPHFDLQFDTLAFWPNARHPRYLVWLGDPEQTTLKELVKCLQTTFPKYAERRRFKPHITLARFRQARVDSPKPVTLPQLVNIPTTRWSIEQVHLYQSILSPQGAQHKSLFYSSLASLEKPSGPKYDETESGFSFS